MQILLKHVALTPSVQVTDNNVVLTLYCFVCLQEVLQLKTFHLRNMQRHHATVGKE